MLLPPGEGGRPLSRLPVLIALRMVEIIGGNGIGEGFWDRGRSGTGVGDGNIGH